MIENVRHLEPIFMGGLKNFENLDYIGESRGIGLMGALEMVQDKKINYPSMVRYPLASVLLISVLKMV